MNNLALSLRSPVQQRVILVQFSFIYKRVLFYVAVDISGHIGSNGRNDMNRKGCKTKRSCFISDPMSSRKWSDCGNLLFAPQEVITASVYVYMVRCGGCWLYAEPLVCYW